MKLVPRIIKSKKCSICDKYLPRLKEKGVEYEIYDADAPGNQEELDEWKIEKMPVVQIVEIKDNRERIVRYQFSSGTFCAKVINYKIKQIMEKEAKK